jgi:hypothetical protein
MAYFCDQLQLHIIPHGVYQLLHYLSRFADKAGGSIFPGIDRMAWETDRSRNTINHQLSALRRSGVLEVVRDGTRTRPTEYRINLEALPIRPKYDPTARRLPKSATTTADDCRFQQQPPLTTAEIDKRQLPKSATGSADDCRNRQRQLPKSAHDLLRDQDQEIQPLDLRARASLNEFDRDGVWASNSEIEDTIDLGLLNLPEAIESIYSLTPPQDGHQDTSDQISGVHTDRDRHCASRVRGTAMLVDRARRVPPPPENPDSENFDAACYPGAVSPLLAHYSLDHIAEGRTGYRITWSRAVIDGAKHLSRSWRESRLELDGDTIVHLGNRYTALQSRDWYKAAEFLRQAYEAGLEIAQKNAIAESIDRRFNQPEPSENKPQISKSTPEQLNGWRNELREFISQFEERRSDTMFRNNLKLRWIFIRDEFPEMVRELEALPPVFVDWVLDKNRTSQRAAA